jgi:4-amino-4-deoxy-L-arabinose transferase-like glycosyltransferase
VLATAAAFLALELVAAPRYGLHRDELYFLACARHLSWGYVDQPPLVPFVAWVVNGLIGPYAWALRLLPALAGAASAVLTALMARELGAGRRGQILAAVAAATSAEFVAAFHLLSTTAFDCFFWALLTWITLRTVRTQDARWLVPLGVIGGVALLDKWNVAFLLVALVVGLVSGPHRRLLRSRYAAVGGVLCLLIAAPDIGWNIGHQWAQVSMLRSLHAENSTPGASIVFVPSQLVVIGPVLSVLGIIGLVALWRDVGRRWLAVTYLVLLGWFVVSGAKPYYLAGAYFALFAAGGTELERRWRSRGDAGHLRAWVIAMVAWCALGLPLALPLLPQSTLPTGSWEGQVNKDLSATVGWPTYVDQVAALARTLPPGQRARLVLLTGDYGAAGAIDLYGPRLHLPPAHSGHNSYWWWGPAGLPEHSVAIATDVPRATLLRIYRTVRPAGTVRTPGDVWTEERGDPLYVCTDQFADWNAAWPLLRHYG